MDKVKFIYFEGCPEAKNVRSALLVAGIYDFDVIVQDQLPEGNPYLKFSSPSVLEDEELIYGIRTAGERSSCTFDVINSVDDKSLFERFKELKSKSPPISVTGAKKIIPHFSEQAFLLCSFLNVLPVFLEQWHFYQLLE